MILFVMKLRCMIFQHKVQHRETHHEVVLSLVRGHQGSVPKMHDTDVIQHEMVDTKRLLSGNEQILVIIFTAYIHVTGTELIGSRLTINRQ